MNLSKAKKKKKFHLLLKQFTSPCLGSLCRQRKTQNFKSKQSKFQLRKAKYEGGTDTHTDESCKGWRGFHKNQTGITSHYTQNLLQEGFCNSIWLMTQTHGNGHEGWRMAEGTTQLLRWAPGPPSHARPVSSTAELRIHGWQTRDTPEAQVICILCCFPPPPPRWVILPPCAKGIRTSVSNRKLMPERIITAIFTAVCSNLCLAVICCYAPKQVAEKRKYKFYQYAVWNKAPTYERVVKVKAGTIEDESRNNK